MVSLFTAGQKADIITVVNEAVKRKVFENNAEGNSYIAMLMERVPSTSNIDSYCDIMSEKYYYRCLLDVAGGIISDVSEGSADAQELLDSVEQRIFNIRQGRNASGLTHIKRCYI